MEDLKRQIVDSIEYLDYVFDKDESLFDLAVFINELDVFLEVEYADKIILERLLKKIDLVKELYRKYTCDFSRKHSEVLLPDDAVRVLILKLLYLILKDKDFKILNSILKSRDSENINIDSQVDVLIDKVVKVILEC